MVTKTFYPAGWLTFVKSQLQRDGTLPFLLVIECGCETLVVGNKKNPCYLLTNTQCATHVSQCLRFEDAKSVVHSLFNRLNFVVREHDNMTGREIEKSFKKIKKSDEFKDIECFSPVLLSCGGSDEIGNNFLFGSDGIFYSIEQIIKNVCANKDLLGVPKLFILLLKKCAREAFKAAGVSATENDKRNVWGRSRTVRRRRFGDKTFRRFPIRRWDCSATTRFGDRTFQRRTIRR